jgi:hypothetical protein
LVIKVLAPKFLNISSIPKAKTLYTTPLVAHEKGKEKEKTLLVKEGNLENFTTQPWPTSIAMKRQ